jgi:hypothetical protein
MKPDPQLVLGHLAGMLLQEVAPRQQTGYLSGLVGMSGMALAMLTEEWDRAAQRLAEENRAIRVLFRHAETVRLDEALARELRALAGGEDENLRISVLEATNGSLRAALIRLHAAVEIGEDAASRALNAAIWDELRVSTERRRQPSAPF